MPWRRAWQLNPVFLLENRKDLVGYSPQGQKESDTAELTGTLRVCDEIKVMKQLSLLYLCMISNHLFSIKGGPDSVVPDRKLKIVLRKF